ncbi:MAG TPA: hypothetical protein VEB21_18705, partial [Terriglobales bacterium]|nr:hypothetical protein [Terriglobales bacterium]
MTLAESYRDRMFAFLQRALTEIGPRESCSPAERRLGDMVAQTWEEQGHEVRRHEFVCNPRAFLGFIPISAVLYLVATILYWWSPLLSFVIALAGGLLILFELLLYRELIDPLFPEARGVNVYAVVPPRGEVRRRVVISAH